ncbi:Uncharacterised protein [Vibrio cholerae]|nr:Uncharacterised protein [Vibrio cholerae]
MAVLKIAIQHPWCFKNDFTLFSFNYFRSFIIDDLKISSAISMTNRVDIIIMKINESCSRHFR